MKNNFNLDDLEDFLSDSAEQHRMYPSDKVWRNIDKDLHGNKKWPALTFAAFLTGALITAGLILINPDKNLFTIENATAANNDIAEASEALTANAFDKEAVSGAKVIPLRNRKKQENPVTNPVLPAQLAGSNPGLNEQDGNSQSQEQVLAVLQSSRVQIEGSVDDEESITGQGQNILTDENEFSLGSTYSNSEMLDINRTASTAGVSSQQALAVDAPQVSELLVLSNEAILNTKEVSRPFLNNQKNPKLSLVYYITPSISYRYLSEAKVIDLHQQNGPIAPNITHGVNNFVNHKPIAGLEFGAGILYNLSPSVRIRTGLQANIRGYSIEAYASRRESSTIVLNRGFYNDSLIAMSSLSTQDGNQEMNITNRYFELSVPVSMDMRVANWKKIQLYVSAGLQPTYQFNKSMYIVSSDYKNYVQEPDLVRSFNMNSNLEAFMSYKAGGVTWQVGPQIRYQLLPGAKTEYPVRERLIDYGFKIGVVKTIK